MMVAPTSCKYFNPKERDDSRPYKISIDTPPYLHEGIVCIKDQPPLMANSERGSNGRSGKYKIDPPTTKKKKVISTPLNARPPKDRSRPQA